MGTNKHIKYQFNEISDDELQNFKKSIVETELKLKNLSDDDPRKIFYKNILETQYITFKGLKETKSMLERSDEMREFRSGLKRSIDRGNKILYWFAGIFVVLSIVAMLYGNT